MQDRDLRVTSTRFGRRFHVKVEHLPTRVQAEAEGEGYLSMREEAYRLLEGKLVDR